MSARGDEPATKKASVWVVKNIVAGIHRGDQFLGNFFGTVSSRKKIAADRDSSTGLQTNKVGIRRTY